MESTAIYRKPKKWTAAVLGLLIQPVGMLYVARPGWAAVYFALGAIIALGNLFMLRGGLAGNATLLLVAIICAIHAYRLARDYRAVKRPWYSRWHGLVGIGAAFAALAFGVRAFLVEPFRFPSESMVPSIEARAHLIVKKWGYGNYGTYGIHLMRTGMSSRLQRGDIVVFEYPEDRSLSYVRRVIGLPGDRISYYNKRLKINDDEVQIRLTRTAPSPPSNIWNASATASTRSSSSRMRLPSYLRCGRSLSASAVLTPRKVCLAACPTATTSSWVITATTAATAGPGDLSRRET